MWFFFDLKAAICRPAATLQAVSQTGRDEELIRPITPHAKIWVSCVTCAGGEANIYSLLERIFVNKMSFFNNVSVVWAGYFYQGLIKSVTTLEIKMVKKWARCQKVNLKAVWQEKRCGLPGKIDKAEGGVKRRREKRGRDNAEGIERVEHSSGVNLSQSDQCVRRTNALQVHRVDAQAALTGTLKVRTLFLCSFNFG